MFYGRVKQQKMLSDFYHSANKMCALIYGRRRIGKTELVKQSLNNSGIPYIYYECKQTSEANNVQSLSQIVSETFNMPPLGFNNVEPLWEYLFEKAKSQPLVLVIDEYPYLRMVCTGLDSILQSLIDKYNGQSKLKIVLCGSFVEIMKSLIEKSNPLFGRVDLSIHLKAMDYLESSFFYNGFSDSDKVRLYSLLGGVPYYNKLVDPAKSVKHEISAYLRSEISKMTNANEEFEALAKGYGRYHDILSQSHVSSSPTLNDILEKLIKMEIVTKSSPINDENNRKKSWYYISDNLSLFYYRYIFRNQSRMAVMNEELFYNRFIDDDFEHYFLPMIFERVCTQYLIRCNQNGTLADDFEKIGKYYYDIPKEKTNGEFDIVTENQGEYIFYEVKFKNSPMTLTQIEQEIEQVRRSGMKCSKFGFFSKTGFEDDCQNCKEPLILYTLADLFK